MSQCKVWLDNYNGQYYPGAQVQGKVVLNFDSDTKLRGVKVRIVCHEHTEWQGTENYYDSEEQEHKSRNTLFKGDNDAFVTEFMLYGNQAATTSLPVGQHIYPFNITLPSSLPGTFNCEYGSISYKLIACVDRPMAFDFEDQLIFVVVSPIDLNLLQNLQLLESTSYSADKTVCCWCCAQGPVTLDVDLPKRTLTPGETINITARLTNMSNTNIEGIHLELTQKIDCLVDDPSKDEKRYSNTLVDLNEVGLGAHGEHTYTFNVMLPMNAQLPNFSLCKLFKVEYIYKVGAKLPSVHQDLEVFMYPEVGHIQINQSPAGFVSSNNAGYAPYPGGSVPHAPPVGGVAVYPPLVPSAPPDMNPKSQEAFRQSGDNFRQPEQPPPSYESLNSNL